MFRYNFNLKFENFATNSNKISSVLASRLSTKEKLFSLFFQPHCEPGVKKLVNILSCLNITRA